MTPDSITRARIAALRPFLDNPSDETWQNAVNEILVLEPVKVAVHVEGGLVQHARSNRPNVEISVADLDTFEHCAGDEQTACDPEEDASDRLEHEDHRKRYRAYQALPYEVR